MYTLFRTSGLAFVLCCFVAFTSCEQAVEHTAPAVNPKDSAATMISYGVNTLISDSGVVKYRLVTERYEVNQVKNPSRWIFDKGVFLEEFDENFHVQLYIQCDTAYYYDQKRLWELRGRVRVKTKDGVRFYSEELFRDENQRELYSNKFSRLITPDRQLQGNYFRSDERMTRYYVSNSKGSFARTDIAGKNDTLSSAPDTLKEAVRLSATPQRRSVQ
ncbi:LPS export ABC transporter periplasmic protein LptC [Hoylesella shahii]|uniref:LPS export ABC transporter periplasmic protein LptC n=1 Tax=Hoylesella shahii TaxID=228603 RepID=UPI0028E4C6AC|nr:LPS export ABC transporter periplasmic protein LptC [Hoylesella shahii]